MKIGFLDIIKSLFKQNIKVVDKQKTEIEKAIVLSKIKYQTLANMSPVGIFQTTANGKTTYVNPQWCKISKLLPSEAMDDSWLNAVHPDDRKLLYNNWYKAVSNKTASYSEYRFLHNDKSITWVLGQAIPEIDDNNNIIGYVGTITNITQIKLFEAKLNKAKEDAEESKTQYQNLANISPVGIFQTSAKGDTIYVNPKWSEITGISLENVIENGWLHIIHPEDREFQIRNWHNATAKKEGSRTEYRLLLEDHSIKWVLGQAVPEFDTHNNIIGYIGTMTDITEIKLVELELSNAKNKAEESDKLKTAFLQNISHEVRTPMNAIIGFSGMLNDTDLTKDKRECFSNLIINNSNQLLSIITNIVTISSIETNQEKINFSNFNLNETMAGLLEFFKTQASLKKLSISCNIDIENKFEIYSDKTKIIQILTNLLNNAIKFTEQGSVEFGYTIKENNIEFYIKDTGIGIKSQHQLIIFNRFMQADIDSSKIYGGTGLGLSISKGFVDLLGGEIWIKSQVDKGSTFYFTIPHKIS